MSVLAWNDYQPNVVYVRLVCPVCDADLDPTGPFEIQSAEHGTGESFVEEDTGRLLRGLIELIGTEVERHEDVWHLMRQKLRGWK